MANGAENPRPPESLGPFMPLIAIFAVADFLIPVTVRANDAPFLVAILWGALLGQSNLLCLWAVFGAQRLLARWLGSLAVAVLLYGVLLLGDGLAFEPPDPDLRVAVAGALISPLLLLGAQVPLWTLRMATGWRIVVDGTPDAGSPRQSRQFALQHIFGATTALAVALGLAGLALPLLDGPDATPEPSVWLVLIGGCLAYGVWTLLWILPCLWVAFIARDKAAGTAIIAAYAAGMSSLIVIGVSILSGGRFEGAAIGFLVVFLLHASLAAVLLGSLHLLRYSGYTLLRPGRRQPPAASASSSPCADVGDPSLPPSA